jgi:hypothetical protein
MLLGVKGGLSRGGVGICKIGRGGAPLVKGSVTPGTRGMSGPSDRALMGEVKMRQVAKVLKTVMLLNWGNNRVKNNL